MAKKTDIVTVALEALTADYGREAVTAAAKAIGIRLKDLEEVPAEQLAVSERVPDDKAQTLRQKKAGVWDGVRQQRLAMLRAKLRELKPDEVHRFAQCGNGVNTVDPNDIPVEGLGGMGEFKEGVQKMMQKSKRDQERKANMIVTDFLAKQQAAKDADQRAADLAQRQREFKQAQADKFEARRKELQKKEQKRKDGAARAAAERREYEDKCEADMEMRRQRANKTRAEIYNPQKLREKAMESEKKRTYAYVRAEEFSDRVQGEIAEKMRKVNERLEARDEAVKEDIKQKVEASVLNFEKKRQNVQNLLEDERITRETNHAEYIAKCNTMREQGREILVQRSKSCGDIRRKMFQKQQSNIDRVDQARVEAHTQVLERQRVASERCADLGQMRLKCGNDIFSYQEVKHNIFGQLNSKNRDMVKRSQDAAIQALVIELAERDAAEEMKRKGRKKQNDYRQKVFGETLKLADASREAFQKIQSSNNPEKIAQVMGELGLPMPKLPDKAGVAEQEEEEKPAF